MSTVFALKPAFKGAYGQVFNRMPLNMCTITVSTYILGFVWTPVTSNQHPLMPCVLFNRVIFPLCFAHISIHSSSFSFCNMPFIT